MAGNAKDFEQQCSDALGTPRAISLGLIGVSVVVLLFLGLTMKPRVPQSSVTQDDVAAS